MGVRQARNRILCDPDRKGTMSTLACRRCALPSSDVVYGSLRVRVNDAAVIGTGDQTDS
jgi:hypothetical protein